MKRAVAIRHVRFEDLGSFGPVLAEAGFDVCYVDVDGDHLDDPRARDADVLVILGGPISAYDDRDYPFLSTELKLIEARLAANRPTLGICLGSQLIAKAAGANVYRGIREIGFAPVKLTPAGENSCLAPLSDDGTVLHWHGDTFDLPKGATLLASTEANLNQAFAYGPNILGLQFHLEISGGFERWLIGHGYELATHNMDPRHLRAQFQELTPKIQARAQRCLSIWISQTSA